MSDDITRCTTDRCPLAQKCARKRLPAALELGSWQDFPGGDDCPAFLPNQQKSLFDEEESC